MAHTEGKVVTIGVTGASGAIYAQTILRALDADARAALGGLYPLVAGETGRADLRPPPTKSPHVVAYWGPL